MKINRNNLNFKVAFFLSLSFLIIFEPTSSLAKTKYLNSIISANSNLDFTTLIQQAEHLTTKLIEQEFIDNSATHEVAITITGERNGQQVPLLYTKVSRQNWQTQPQVESWTKYFSKADLLLGFFNSQPSSTISQRRTVALKPIKRIIKDDPGFRDD